MRFLTTLVVGLAVLIVAAAGLLAWGLFSKTRIASPAAAAVVVDLGLPQGCAIQSATSAGENILVHVRDNGATGSCDKIFVVDWARSRILGTIEARPAPQPPADQGPNKP